MLCFGFRALRQRLCQVQGDRRQSRLCDNDTAHKGQTRVRHVFHLCRSGGDRASWCDCCKLYRCSRLSHSCSKRLPPRISPRSEREKRSASSERAQSCPIWTDIPSTIKRCTSLLLKPQEQERYPRSDKIGHRRRERCGCYPPFTGRSQDDGGLAAVQVSSFTELRDKRG